MESRIRKDRYFFPLTSLQIGDMQSYLSHLTLFLAPESNKLFILVDNRPWLIEQDTRPAHLWQLMVTKSRLSPFANTRTRKKVNDADRKFNIGNLFKFESVDTRPSGETDSSTSNSFSLKRLNRWYALVDAALYQNRILLPVKKLKGSFLLNKELHRTLFGYIVFEVAWKDVRGINYVNELQTDTSMALEAKLMKRWEFDSIEQASTYISLWFLGTYSERYLLQKYLDDASSVGDMFDDALEYFHMSSPEDASENSFEDSKVLNGKCSSNGPQNALSTNDLVEHDVNLPCTPPPDSGPYKRRKIMKLSNISDFDEVAEGASPRFSVSSSTHSIATESGALVSEASYYRDVFILFRFNDPDLPFKLKDIIMQDLRLLTLLEYGLPSWVIFLQSYPVLCKIYRPWMCPLARALYVLISVITVLIGFYDLYKNVPLLKSTASHLFGPFFDWIETWEMVSRIKYLGTMLFLHNFEKAITWFLMISRAIRSALAVLTKPFAGPIMELVELCIPVWNIFIEVVYGVTSVMWDTFGYSWSILVTLAQIIIWPFELLISLVCNTATSVIYPIIVVFWEMLLAPVRLVFAAASFIAMVVSYTYYSLREVWLSISTMIQFASNAEATVTRYEPSMWRSLWNDLFSQVFRAIKTILYGFAAFFAACNRHRLSIYNHIQEFVQRLSSRRKKLPSEKHRHGKPKHSAQSVGKSSKEC